MKKYEGICGKYEGIFMSKICQYVGSGTPISIWALGLRKIPSYSLGDLGKFQILPLHMGLGTWKNSTPELPPGLWDLEKFRTLPLYL